MTTYPVIQKAIDLTWQQGRRSVDKDGNCLYRGPDRCRCAIGQIMPDYVVPDCDNGGLGVEGLAKTTLLACGLNPDDTEMMRQADLLQSCHDNADDTEFRTDFARRVGYNLPGYTIPDGTS